MAQAIVEIGGEEDEDLSRDLTLMLNMTKLWQHCQDFIKKQEISCAETVYQTDRVIESGYEFIAGVCEIVGYHKHEDDNED